LEQNRFATVLFCCWDCFVILLALSSCNCNVLWWYCLVMYCLEDVLFCDAFFLCCTIKQPHPWITM
jgi:hypothetical protein